MFHTEFDDLQVGYFDPLEGFVVSNAAKAVSEGIELEGLYAVTESLSLGVTAAYLNAEYREFTAGCPANSVQAAKLDCYPNPNGTAGNLVQDLKGVQLDNAPEVTATMFADYTVPVLNGLLFGSRLDASYKDETSLDFSQDEESCRQRFLADEPAFQSRVDAGYLDSRPHGLQFDRRTTSDVWRTGVPAPGCAYWQNRARGREVELSATYRFTR